MSFLKTFPQRFFYDQPVSGPTIGLRLLVKVARSVYNWVMRCESDCLTICYVV